MSPADQEIIGPASSYYVSQRLRLHYVDWGNEGAPLLVLVHGGRDHARSWDWVARDLRRDYHVIAPDLRGHGDSSWAIGGHYTISEFVLDVAIEGLGPPPAILRKLTSQTAWERTDEWIRQVRAISSRIPKRYPSIEAAAKRMLEENSFLTPEQAHHLTVHGVARNEDGSYTWKFDNYTRIFYPQRWDSEETRRMWGRISCPTLLMRGTESWAGDPAEDGRMDAFSDARLVNVPDAGHWVHHDQLDAFLREVRAFLDAPSEG